MIDKVMLQSGIIFDLDGTIIDSSDSILDAFQSAYSQDFVPMDYPGDQSIVSHFGKSLDEILDLYEIPSEIKEQFSLHFEQKEVESDKFMVFEGMRKVIQFVKKDYPLTIVTSKGRKPLDHVLDLLNINADVVISVNDVDHSKPHPEPLLKACNELEIEANPFVYYVGDSLHDIEAAENAGITPIGVAWGAHGRKIAELYPDIHFVYDADELLELLKGRL